MENDSFLTEVSALVQEVVSRQKHLESLKAQFRAEHQDVMAEYDKFDEEEAVINKLKNTIKQKLVDNKDFDVHEEFADNVRVSVSRIPRVEVADLEHVPDSFKRVETVADTKKASEYLRVMGEAPEGFIDKSYHRLNWREKGVS